MKTKDKIFSSIFDMLPVHIYWTDTNLILRGCNQKQADNFNVTIENAIGKSIFDFEKALKWEGGIAEKVYKEYKRILDTKVGSKSEYTVKMPDAKTHTYLSLTEPLIVEDQCEGVVGISFDITELKETQQALLTSTKKAEAASEAKSKFLANMSHDIRTPITGMMASIQSMYGQAPNDKFKEDIRDLMHTTSELLRLLNDVIETVRIESGQITDELQEFNLWDIIEHNIQLAKPAVKVKNLDLNLFYADNCPFCFIGNKRLIASVILNLVSNAIKFTKEGQISIIINVVDSDDENINLQIIVKDTGIGIPESQKEAIFEQFLRLTPSYENNYKGYGIGLYTVKSYVDLMKGKIEVQSKEGSGTSFIIVLPLRKAKNQDLREEELIFLLDEPQRIELNEITKNISVEKTLKNIERTPSGLSKNNILIVEDSPMAAKLVKEQFTALGYHVTVAETGADALQFTTTTHYVLILMDIGLPDTDGFAVTKKIREMKENPNSSATIIALSGHTGPEHINKCLSLGMNNALSKPIRPAQIKELINTYINEKSVSQNEDVELLQKNKLNIIDINANMKAHSMSESDAKEMITMLANELRKECQIIKSFFEDSNFSGMLSRLHKLIGGMEYCGVPELLKAAKNFYSSIKNYKNERDIEKNALGEKFEVFQKAVVNFYWAYEGLFA